MEKRKTDCGHCKNKLCMHKVPIFHNLDQEDILEISNRIQHRHYQKGEPIFSIGDPLDFIVIINEGSAKAFKYTPEGREQILYIFTEGDFFGEKYLLSKETAAYTVEALEPVFVCMLSREDFKTMLIQHSNIGIKIIEELGNRMARFEQTLENMGVRSVDSRMAGLLLEYAERYGKKVPDGILIKLPLSREGLANYLGIARETVSRKFGQLENGGIIQSVANKSILILDMVKLEEIAGVND